MPINLDSQRHIHTIKGLLKISHRLSGWETFSALKQAVDELTALAPENHDILIKAFDLAVTEIVYVEPHTLLFRGFDQEGNHSAVVAHFSQVIAHVVYLPKRGDARVITGFARHKIQDDG